MTADSGSPDTQAPPATPNVIEGPFHDTHKKTFEWDDIVLVQEHVRSSDDSFTPAGPSGGTVNAKSSSTSTMTIKAGKFTWDNDWTNSHAFPSPARKPCGCGGSSGESGGGTSFVDGFLKSLIEFAPSLVSYFAGGRASSPPTAADLPPDYAGPTVVPSDPT